MRRIKEKTWWSPKEITFSRKQLVKFLLPNLGELRLGVWPKQNDETGYEDTRSFNDKCYANHESPCLVAAEIDVRLALIGEHATILIEVACLKSEDDLDKKEYDRELFSIAKGHHMDRSKLTAEYYMMSKFISGWKRPAVKYKYWKEQKLIDDIVENLGFDNDSSSSMGQYSVSTLVKNFASI